MTFLFKKTTSPLRAVLQVRQRAAVRRQVAALRLELSGDHGHPTRSRRARKTRAPILTASAFRESILRSEKKAQLGALLDRAIELGLNLENSPLSPTTRFVAQAMANTKSTRAKHSKVLAAVTFLSALVVVGVIQLNVADWSSAATMPTAGANAVELAPTISALAVEQGRMFFTREIRLDYAGGRVILSGAPSPIGRFSVDDAVAIAVRRPDGSHSTWAHTFNVDCHSNSFVDSQDLTWMFLPGSNIVRVELSDVCGATWGTSGAIVLTNVPV